MATPAESARRPVAADSVAVLRVGFGLLVTISALRFLGRGWVDSLYLEPANHLTHPGFEWVAPLPAPALHLLVASFVILGLAIAAGYRQRLAAALFVVGFGYTELIEASLYLNHYWFMTLVGLLLVLLPVNHHWSVDAARGRVARSSTVPTWVVWTFRAQVGVVYVFAGVAKLNRDWLLAAQPMRLWLSARTDLAIVGPVLDEPLVAYLASWSGAFFDCTIVFWLLWPRTRLVAYGTLVVFHLITGALFPIGVFPLVMITAATVFFAPDWPRRIVDHLRFGWTTRQPSATTDDGVSRPGRFTLAALAVLAVIQIALPLRHYASDGNVRWNERGYLLAWRVMLTEKAGFVDYRVTDPATGRSWYVDPSLVLTDWQTAHAATRPDMIHATAHLVAEFYRNAGRSDVEVRADAWVSMNGEPASRLIDPTVDLAAHARGGLPDGTVLEPVAG